MRQILLYPLQLEPIYQYRPWGGRRLAGILSKPLPDGPVGEAWILSDREDHQSRVVNGRLKGQTINQLLVQFPDQLLGKLVGRFQRFPLLLKFLDAHKKLSLQVHPSDQKTKYLPAGEQGKTEAWVVLEAGKKGRIFAGLKSGTTPDNLKLSITNGSVAEHLASFIPKPGDGVFLPAGTVHALGGDVVVFEIQQNSDVTFRIYDWNHIDPKTNKPRGLQVEQALDCIDFDQGETGPVIPVVEASNTALRERLFFCKYFGLWRIQGESPFIVGVKGIPRILVCISGYGQIAQGGDHYTVGSGDVFLLPVVAGVYTFEPQGAVTLLEIALPE